MNNQNEFSTAEIERYQILDKIDVIEHLMQNELGLKALVDVRAKFSPNLYAIDEEYLKSVKENSRIRYNQLADEMKILQLKLKTVHEKIAREGSEVPF